MQGPEFKLQYHQENKRIIPLLGASGLCLSIILATQEAEIRRIVLQSQPRQIVPRDPIWKNPSQKRAGGVAQGEGPEFKHQYHKKNVNLHTIQTPAQPCL
jgi:hypothetical protein